MSRIGKRSTRALVAMLVLAGSLSGTALADAPQQPGKHWIPQAKVKQILIKDGFSQITAIRAGQDGWEGRGVEDAISYRFHVDPHSGALSKTRIVAPDN